MPGRAGPGIACNRGRPDSSVPLSSDRRMLEMPATLKPRVYEANGHGPFAHCRCHPLDRSASHVSRREHAGLAGFEQVRFVAVLSSRAIFCRASGIAPSEDEPTIVERELIPEPVRTGLSTDEYEELARLERAALTGLVVLYDERLECPVPDQLAHLRVAQHLYFRSSLDPIGQVARHVPPQVTVAYQQPDPGRVFGQEQRRLSGRVATSHDRHRIAALPPGSRRSRY
jgi:hypothetical protein